MDIRSAFLVGGPPPLKPQQTAINALILPCDVSNPNDVKTAFTATANWGRLMCCSTTPEAVHRSVDDTDVDVWLKVVAVNLTGSFFAPVPPLNRCDRNRRKVAGLSITGRYHRMHHGRVQPYTSTKHAITGLTKSLSLDGRDYDICASQIDIGNALTDMAVPMTKGVLQPDGSVRAEATMDVAHVASSVLHTANLPLDANVQFMTVMAPKMPFIGRG